MTRLPVPTELLDDLGIDHSDRVFHDPFHGCTFLPEFVTDGSAPPNTVLRPGCDCVGHCRVWAINQETAHG